MKKIYYYKLIRDKIPDRIRLAGAQAKYKKLNAKTFEEELIKKVEEEASGMQKAKNRPELADEIADVIDVIEEIKKLKKISTKDIAKAQKKNFLRKGGFKKRLYLYWSSDDGYKTNEKRRDRRGNFKK